MRHKLLLPDIIIILLCLGVQSFSPVMSATTSFYREVPGITSNDLLSIKTAAAESSGQADTSAASSNSGELNLRVFPNPATDFIRIEWQASRGLEIQAELFDLFGRKITVEKTESSGNHIQLDVQSLQRSAYLLKVTSSNGRFSKTYRIIKY